MNAQPKIFVAGHRGMVGSAILRALRMGGRSRFALRTRAEMDLTDQRSVMDFFARERPDEVYVAAARVGGIHANNSYPAEFIYSNLMVQSNVIHAAYKHGVRKLLFLGSSCIYPRLAAQPMGEDALLTGTLEPTNEPYAVAKIAGIKMCESYNRQYGTDYRSVMPTNLYGPGDNYHPENSHVVPAMLRRFHEAKAARAPTVSVWGTGTPCREFLYVDDMARACVHVMEMDEATWGAATHPMQRLLNVGYGSDISIADLARTVARVVGYEGQIEFDPSRPDGAPRKLLDSSRLQQLGWQPAVSLEQGLALAYSDFVAQSQVMMAA
jgi:GDP-L-fucose synthase